MKKKSYDKKYQIIILFLLIVCVLFVLWGFWRKSKLLNNHSLAIARIYEYAYGGRGSGGRLAVRYTMNIKGKEYKASTMYGATDFNCIDKFIGKIFPAVYNPDYPSISSILILPADYERYHYSFPDSLKWIKDYLK